MTDRPRERIVASPYTAQDGREYIRAVRNGRATWTDPNGHTRGAIPVKLPGGEQEYLKPAPATPDELEVARGGRPKAEIERLLMNGEHMPILRRALDAFHAGDDAAKWHVLLSGVAAASTDRIPVFATGGPREGKSHVLESVGQTLFPSRFKRYDEASAKVLYYEADKDPTFLRGKIVYLDEIADREHLWPIIKKIADANSDRLEHHTVIDRKPVTFKLDGLPTPWTAGAKDVSDDQLNGRFNKLSIDDSPEQDVRVMEYGAAADAKLSPVTENPDVVTAGRFLEIIMEGGPYRVLIPEAQLIDYGAFRFAQPRVDASMFRKIVKATALLNRHRRPSFPVNGVVVVLATEADLREAHRLWRALGPTRDTKLDRKAFLVLEKVPFDGPAETARIKEELRGKLAPSTVAKKLEALYDRGFVDRERGERFNVLLWERVIPDDVLKKMKEGSDGLVSTIDSLSFSVPWKDGDATSPTWRKQAVEKWAVSQFLQFLPGFEKSKAAELAERIVGGDGTGEP